VPLNQSWFKALSLNPFSKVKVQAQRLEPALVSKVKVQAQRLEPART